MHLLECGKTTILRDLIKKISDGIEYANFKGVTVGVVDERGELSAMYKGVPQNDVGLKTDILENIPKSIGIKMLIRTMSPQVICADEIGTLEDIQAIQYAFCSGVKGIFTAHGDSLAKVNINPILKKLLNTCIIERIIFLSDKNKKGEISAVFELDTKKSIKYANYSSKNRQAEYIFI